MIIDLYPSISNRLIVIPILFASSQHCPLHRRIPFAVRTSIWWPALLDARPVLLREEATMAEDPDDDASKKPVGYGQPPVHGQFKKGQSGNPSGKKKGAINLKKIFIDVFSEEMTFTEAGVEKRGSASHFLVKRLRQEALKGDKRMMRTSLSYLEKYSDPATDHVMELPDEDEAILRRCLGYDGAQESAAFGAENDGENRPDGDAGEHDG